MRHRCVIREEGSLVSCVLDLAVDFGFGAEGGSVENDGKCAGATGAGEAAGAAGDCARNITDKVNMTGFVDERRQVPVKGSVKFVAVCSREDQVAFDRKIDETGNVRRKQIKFAEVRGMATADRGDEEVFGIDRNGADRLVGTAAFERNWLGVGAGKCK